MKKISEVVKTQAEQQFQQKKQQIIRDTLYKNYKHKPNFQEILNTYLLKLEN